MKYKLRAECAGDAVCFNQMMGGELSSAKLIEDKLFPDVEFEFESDADLDEIKSVIGEIPDSHVMYQTVSPIEEYTGVRS